MAEERVTIPSRPQRSSADKASTGLTPRQGRFVQEYLIDLNGKQAAIRAGYKPKAAEVQASHLLRNPKVHAAVTQAQAARQARVQICQDDVLRELLRVARSDIRALFDSEGELRPVRDLLPDAAAAIASVEVREGDRRGQRARVTKVRLWDKVRALELLAKHLGLLMDRLEVEGSLSHLSDEELRTQIEAALIARWPEYKKRLAVANDDGPGVQ